MIKTDTLPQFLRNKVAENDAFGLVEACVNYYVAAPQKKFLRPCIYLSLS